MSEEEEARAYIAFIQGKLARPETRAAVRTRGPATTPNGGGEVEAGKIQDAEVRSVHEVHGQICVLYEGHGNEVTTFPLLEAKLRLAVQAQQPPPQQQPPPPQQQQQPPPPQPPQPQEYI